MLITIPPVLPELESPVESANVPVDPCVSRDTTDTSPLETSPAPPVTETEPPAVGESPAARITEPPFDAEVVEPPFRLIDPASEELSVEPPVIVTSPAEVAAGPLALAETATEPPELADEFPAVRATAPASEVLAGKERVVNYLKFYVRSYEGVLSQSPTPARGRAHLKLT